MRIHHSMGEVEHEFVGFQLDVLQLCDTPVARGDRRDNTQVDIES